MPKRPAKTSKSPATAPAVTGRRIAAKADDAKGDIKAQRIDKTGLTSRIQAHVAARGQRAQAQRDSR